MAANPRMLTADVTVSWDGGTFFAARGTIVDIPAGGALEAAYGADNLVALAAGDQGLGDPDVINVGDDSDTGGGSG